ncbi:DedA family protein [Arthrobacter castelli]|uniref:DedA family protein n=1 Tax=Arthrobacter castelli TaxID=271431 RepID=UPI00041BBCD7|nr:VTT domain-containing protein [Arthrobacter castelli]
MEFVDGFTAWVEAVNDTILDAAGSGWIYLLLFALCIVDAFFPPVPSETVVVALAAVAMTSGVPNLWVITILAAAGAIIGDNTAYVIGRSIGTRRFRWMRRPKVAESFSWAGSQLDKRGPILIMAARYIPVGRTAVNMTAGATGFHRVQFFWLSVIAGCSWALYSVGIGILAGHWVQDNPFLGVALAVGIAMVLGLIVDFINRRLTARRAARAEAAKRWSEPTRL